MGRLKRSKMNRIAAFIAAAVACVQLAACGSGGGNTTVQKEFVYVPEYQQISGKNDSIDNVNIVGDTIYYTGGEYDEEAEAYTNYLFSLKIGEKEPVRIPLDFGPDSSISKMSVDPEGNLQLVVFTYLYEDETDSGTDADDTQETPEAEEGENEAAGEEEESSGQEEDEDSAEEEGTASSSGVTSTTIVSGSGGFISTESAAEVGIVGDEYREPTSQKTEICKLSPDGTVISTVDIGSALGEDVYIQYMETDKEGHIYIGYDQAVIVFDIHGKKLFEIELTNWLNNMFSTKDGTVMVCYYGQDKMEVHKIDFAKKGIGEEEKNLIIFPYGNYIFSKGVETDLIFSVENSLYSYNFGDEAPTKLLNWIDCDINSDDLRSFAALPDGRILAVTSYWESETNVIELVYLTKKKGSEIPEKKILTYGTMYLAYDVRKQIIDFNKTNQEYRIEVKEYVDVSSDTADFSTGQTQLNADIVSGNGPDIIDFSNGSIEQYSKMGVIEDLYSYLDKDPELNREDYLPNILKAFESDGKLNVIAPKFYINTIIAKVSDVGERNSITLDEIMQLTEKMPEGTELYQYSTKSSILSNNIMRNIDDYINWETGECNFNGDDFIKALEFSNSFDSEIEFDEDRPGTASRLQDGSLLMLNASISSVQDYQMYEGMFGEPIAFVGFPTNDEVGSCIASAGSMLGISSKSKYKDGAWQFIRMSITKEEQESPNNRSWGFPIMKSAIEAQFKEDMKKEYYKDENGNKVEQSKTSWGYDDFNIEIYAASEEQVAVVRDLIESVDTLYQYDEQINNIISEETAAFFEGQKNVREVADIIQNRLQIYVNENR